MDLQPITLEFLVNRLKARVDDEVFPPTDEELQDLIVDALSEVGYPYGEVPIEKLPREYIPLVLKVAQKNGYYNLAGKHARFHRFRIEGDLEVHQQHTASNYLKLATALEKSLDEELAAKVDTITVSDASRWRVSDNRMVPKPDGSAY